jgi:hypothetical protein
MAEEETEKSWMESTLGMGGKDLLSGAIAFEEAKAKQGSGAANQAATMQTPTQDSQPQAQTAPTGGGDSGGGKILGMDRTTAMMVGGGVLALGLVAVLASR